jgi:hypothetical protein
MLLARPFVVVVALVIPTFALAEPGGPQGACKSDLQLLCAGVQPGGGRIRDCMKEHRTQLSAGCKMAIADRMLERPSHAAANGSASGKPVQQPSSIKSVQQ